MTRFSVSIALLAAFLGASAKDKKRTWQQGTITAVFSPKDQKTGDQPTVDPYTTPNDQSMYPRASVTGSVPKWVYLIEAGGARIVATSDSVGKRSYLAKLVPGQTVKLAVERSTLYILEPGGKQYRLRIRERTEQSRKE